MESMTEDDNYKYVKDSIDILQNTLREAYVKNLAIKHLDKQVCRNVENIVLQSFEGEAIDTYGLSYELIGVTCDIHVSSDHYEIVNNRLNISLHYMCASKLPKKKMDLIKRQREGYKNHPYLHPTKHNPPLWQTDWYRVDIEQFCLGNFNPLMEEKSK
jgi:hypothetical protein